MGATSSSNLQRFNEAKKFLDALDPDGRFTFSTLDDNKVRCDKHLMSTYHGKLEECFDHLAWLNKNGAGVFVCINETNGLGRKDSNIQRVRAVFADLDGAPVAPVTQFNSLPHAIVKTSEEHWHCYWFCQLPLPAFSPIQKGVAIKFDGDPSISNLGRLMRLPGFYHRKPKPPGVADKLVQLEPGYPLDRLEMPPYTSEQIHAAFPVAVKNTRNRYEPSSPRRSAVRTSERQARITDRSTAGRELDMPVSEGRRNHEMTRRFGFLLWRFGSQRAQELARAINSTVFQPPLTDQELEGIFVSIEQKDRQK